MFCEYNEGFASTTLTVETACFKLQVSGKSFSVT